MREGNYVLLGLLLAVTAFGVLTTVRFVLAVRRMKRVVERNNAKVVAALRAKRRGSTDL